MSFILVEKNNHKHCSLEVEEPPPPGAEPEAEPEAAVDQAEAKTEDIMALLEAEQPPDYAKVCPKISLSF